MESAFWLFAAATFFLFFPIWTMRKAADRGNANWATAILICTFFGVGGLVAIYYWAFVAIDKGINRLSK